jgi:hypothetical protein
MSIQDIVNALPKGVTGQQQMGVPPARQMPMSPRGPSAPLYGGYARGGLAHYAMGGPAMPMGAPMPSPMSNGPMMPPQGMPPQGMPPMGGQRPPQQNPLAEAQKFAVGHKIGQALRNHIKGQGVFQGAGPVKGAGGGQDDAINAKLSNGEYVHSADVVSALGDGSSEAGGQKLKQMDAAIRAHKTSHGKHFPPKAKSPLSYIGAA